MDESQVQNQIVQLVQAAMAGDQKATQYIQQVMQAAQQGDQQAVQLAQMIQAVAQQMQQQQVQAAKFGAKLNYLRQLKGKCPEGYEMEYYKDGGRLCKRCTQVKQDGGEMEAPKNPIDAFKCGRKMKKNACGGSMNKKIDKHFNGGKQKRPFTGFEGLSYEYEAPRPSNQGRADRPEREAIYNNGNYVMDRERYYDADLYEDSKQLQPIEDFIYSTSEGIDLTPTDVRIFDSLKRHALMNKSLNLQKFSNGSKIKKSN